MCELKDQPFAVKHYSADEFPSIKGNGFDGIRIGEDREEATEFIRWVNSRLELLAIKSTEVSDAQADLARLTAERDAANARIVELEIAVDRLQILGHSAFQGGWQRVAEMMSNFDAIVTASIGDDADARMTKRINRMRGEFHAAQGVRAALVEACEGGRDGE